jgi:hypothetical protein
MQFFTTVAAALLAAVAQADNIVTFKSMDGVDRSVYFTPAPGHSWPAVLSVPAGQSVDQPFEYGWEGNWYAVKTGDRPVPGMLGEVKFNAFENKVFYDVSAIVNPNDWDNVSELYPIEDPNKPVSGCRQFPCAFAYYAPDDVQTRVSPSEHLVCTLGMNGAATERRDIEEDNEPFFDRSVFTM